MMRVGPSTTPNNTRSRAKFPPRNPPLVAGATACKLCTHGSYSNSSGASFALHVHVLIFRGSRCCHGSVALSFREQWRYSVSDRCWSFSYPSIGSLICGSFPLASHGLVRTDLPFLAQLECNQCGGWTLMVNCPIRVPQASSTSKCFSI